ncbi:MarR family winged helix-turn-helix transcriptional regulator [Cryptosporangium sp. NPDC048952]|uniref:MarR family winged helix-turn-helix transcriptional regulator n=1 Tax=Cryptosporangium sp. NPDC048952 TaxID=3363961 RepID=UPI00371F8354
MEPACPAEGAPPEGTSAFLLSQLGALSARMFAERVAALDLTPPQAGLLRLVAGRPGQSQQALAAQLGTPPSRMVALIDGLEERGLLARRRNADDRRLSSLHVTAFGMELLTELGGLAVSHDDEVCAGLDDSERAQLHALLVRLAVLREQRPGVHPGFRGPPG